MPSTTGERQIGTKQKEIAVNHRARYEWAGKLLRLHVPKGGHVLDAACGCAYGSQILAGYGYKVTAYDRSDEAAEWCKFFNHPFVTFIQADVMEAVNHKQHYDAAVSIETIEHIESDADWVRGLYMATPLLVGTVPNQAVVEFNQQKHPFHFRHYTKTEVEHLFRAWELSEWSTQYGKYENYEMRPGHDGMTLGFLAKR
jgi:cyclopropane fatty-acyl-phospholipid synthase-like methyltransferase|tara:strand:- start:11731 stop:12327 length:597 start_codon:yes stop_codon:yes gene_type:complete